METTIYIEIPVKVTFSVDPGQKETWGDNGGDPPIPGSIEDKDFDEGQVLTAVRDAILSKKSNVDEELMEVAVQAKRTDEEDRGDKKYQEIKDAYLET